MHEAIAARFAGLSAAMPALLDDLRRNNRRDWFLAHKEDYRRQVSQPLAALGDALGPTMRAIDGALVAKVSRPQRDTRFSADKSPYRSEAWLTFRQLRSDWTDTPAFFLEVTPDRCRWGMGFYAAQPATMAALREAVGQGAERWCAALAAGGRCGFVLEGDPYRRARPVPAGLPAALAELYGRRNAYMVKPAPYQAEGFGPEFAEVLGRDFDALGSLYRLFRDVVLSL